MQKNVIETNKLSFFYGSHRGIEDVSLCVKKGEVFGFLGPNGAGKTTMLRLLTDLIRPTSGSASIFGMDCHRDGVTIRKKIGYLPGEFSLYPGMTALAFLNMIASLRKKHVDKSYREQLFQRLNFDPSRKMKTYSRGNKQKIGLIAAFMHQPELLILDEPTGGLDPLMQHVTSELVMEAKAQGRTTVFSSHILPEVQAVCDRVGIIRHGKLVQTDSVSSLVHQQFTRLQLQLKSLPHQDAFAIDGVKELERNGNMVTLEITRNMSETMRIAASFEIQDIQTLPVTLDDIFMVLYSDDNGSTSNG